MLNSTEKQEINYQDYTIIHRERRVERRVRKEVIFAESHHGRDINQQSLMLQKC